MNSSELYDSDLTGAIKAAILAADTTCPEKNVWPYRRHVVFPSIERAREVFGAMEGEDRVFHGWEMSWQRSTMADMEAEDGDALIVSTVEVWLLKGYYSWLDEKKSDIFFRKLIASVQSQFYVNEAIYNLEAQHQLEFQRADLISNEVGYIVGTEVVHEAVISLQFLYKDHQ